MVILKQIWRRWIMFAVAFGIIVSTIIMGAFYYTIFALFAIPFRLFGGNPLKRQGLRTNWIVRLRTATSLADFKDE